MLESGAYINVDHHEEHGSLFDSIFLQPKQTVLVNGRILHETQQDSFDQSKCVHRYGQEVHDFNGVPFTTAYNPRSCHDLCLAKKLYKLCQCSPLVGWNLTKTECLDDAQVTDYRTIFYCDLIFRF